MPIVGLTDQGPSLPEIGTLRKGAPKPVSGPGKDLKYFRFDSGDEEASKRFKEAYGGEPYAIRVFLPFATTDENFEAWKEEWTASSLKHRCDGREMVLWLKNGAYSTEKKPCPGGCKQVGRLKVIIPELKRWAFVTALTTSIHDILQLHANLQALESARGDLRGIPLVLKRVPRKISTPRGNGERARTEKWLLTIEAQPQWVELQLASQERQALGQAQPLALPEWGGDDDDTDIDEAPAAGIVDAEREKVLGDMRRMFLDKGKTEAEWQIYQETLKAKPTENLKTMRANWQATVARAQAAAATAAAPAAQPMISEESIHYPLQPELTAEPIHQAEIVEEGPAEPALSPIREELEQMIKLLQSKGCSADHINAKIAKLAGGVYAIAEIEEEMVPKVRLMLANYLKMTDPASEIAKEFKKK